MIFIDGQKEECETVTVEKEERCHIAGRVNMILGFSDIYIAIIFVVKCNIQTFFVLLISTTDALFTRDYIIHRGL